VPAQALHLDVLVIGDIEVLQQWLCHR
jgi:hypothetical protein